MNIYQRAWRKIFPAKPDPAKSQLDLMEEHYNKKIRKLEKKVKELKPKPIIITQCPHCNAQRRTERLSRADTEVEQDGWWWSYVIFGSYCLTCGTKFTWETERKRGESIKGRQERLEREERERKKRAEEDEARRKRRAAEDERRRRTSSSGYSSSSYSFGGGRSGGGGSSGRIRR